ncbi:Protein CBR-GRP-1 [Caenorhabditis briggsae]|uniref:Protein CBR-GRP-1 n=1 Tax=Caenorhabditis briggsae TaxID=6238 RepID=A8Y3J5_CAEBR|nr:Protein CBR-GRP-1 [Caenorhabditis briggsae]CAP39464.2 Protein CBR-GRP-1 [Caenorhabditis briggsae]
MSSRYSERNGPSESEKMTLPKVRKRKAQLVDEIEALKNEVREVDEELDQVYYTHPKSKDYQKIVVNGRKKFNQDPWKALDWLASRNVVAKDPQALALWMKAGEGLSKSAIALRQYLFSFRLPGESQKINRILEKFAEIYALQNPSYGNADQAHTVAYSCIMVNTLLHNPNVKDKPTLEKYIEMNEQLLESGAITIEQLTEVYESVSITQFKIPDEVSPTGKGSVNDILLHAEREGWLFKQSSNPLFSGALSWKKRWFVLSENCLYYFDQMTDKEPKGIITLANVGIRKVEAPTRPFMFEIYSLSDGQIKACKTEQDGRLVEGRHSIYRICAVNDEDMRSWINAISRMMAPQQQTMARPKSTH